jgi:peptidoglycan-associated lipoprotein
MISRLNQRQLGVVVLTMFVLAAASGCKKKAPVAPPPPPPPAKEEAPPPPPPKPTASFSAEPATVERGQCATLTWRVENATQVAINPGVGNVNASGTQRVCPPSTTTYTLSASGPGGSVTASATVNVVAAAPPPPAVTAPKKSFSELLSEQLQDALFDYDRSEIREDARAVLTRNSEALKQIFQNYPDAIVNVEGHCDERGSAEYNLGLGDRRATAAKEFLTELGVPGSKLQTVSYGKERPVCTEANESCWQRNRRVHFSAGQ